LSREVAGAARFDLDHFGAKVRQLMAGERTRKNIREIENADSAQWRGTGGGAWRRNASVSGHCHGPMISPLR